MSIALVVLATACLSACNLTQQQTQQIVTVACAIDADMPAAVTAGTTIATIVDPNDAATVAKVNSVDQAAHPIVQNACSRVLANSSPIPGTVAVTTVPAAPVSTTAPAAPTS